MTQLLNLLVEILRAIGQHLLKDAPEYTALLGLLAVAAIVTMPTPEVIQRLLGYSRFGQWLAVLYKWLYDTMQTFMSARNPHTSTPDRPAQPK